MKKWQKVTIWVASVLIVLVAGGLFAANYAVDKVLNSMVGMSVDDLLEEENIEVTGELVTPDEFVTTSPDGSIEKTDGVESTDPSGIEKPVTSNAGEQNTESTYSDSNEKPKDTTPDGSKSPEATEKPEGDKLESGYSADISVDKAKHVEENITVAEKAKVVTTLMGSLNASDIASLQKLASGGMTTDEKKAAKDILLEKLTEDQYNDLVAIAAKHGLSQGRTYSEILEEEY